MGALCSKSSDHSGGHTVLSASADGARASSSSGKVISGPSPNKPNPREAAAQAAEARVKAAQSRGAKSGVLSAKLAEANKAKRVPEPREEEQLVWD